MIQFRTHSATHSVCTLQIYLVWLKYLAKEIRDGKLAQLAGHPESPRCYCLQNGIIYAHFQLVELEMHGSKSGS